MSYRPAQNNKYGRDHTVGRITVTISIGMSLSLIISLDIDINELSSSN